MKRILKPTVCRIVVLAISVLLQIGVYVALFLFFRDYGIWFELFCKFLSAIAVMRIVLKDSCPEYKIAWIIPVIAFPVFGGILFLIFGRKPLSKRERRRISAITEQLNQCGTHITSSLDRLELVSRTAAFQARYLEHQAYAPVFDGTQAAYFPVGEEMWQAMLKDLQAAEKSIFMEYFIIGEGEMWSSILSILEEKAARGVDVRLMYDDLGCLSLLPYDFAKRMERKGIRCCPFNRSRHIFNSRFNHRDHRKICVIDGEIGYTGGINLADEYINRASRFGHWKDTAVRLEGPGVFGLTALFLTSWDYFYGSSTEFSKFLPSRTVPSSGFVQPFGTSPDHPDSVGESMYINLFHKARDYIYITTPYLIIDSTMIKALTLAARSGIDVRIITPGIPDKKIVYFLTRSYYRILLESGVKIYEYTPGFIHAKSAVCDDSTAVVGTINLDYRSLYLHSECGVWMYGTDCVADVKKDFLDAQEKCREIAPESVQRTSALKRMILAFLRIFAPLF